MVHPMQGLNCQLPGGWGNRVLLLGCMGGHGVARTFSGNWDEQESRR